MPFEINDYVLVADIDFLNHIYLECVRNGRNIRAMDSPFKIRSFYDSKDMNFNDKWHGSWAVLVDANNSTWRVPAIALIEYDLLDELFVI